MSYVMREHLLATLDASVPARRAASPRLSRAALLAAVGLAVAAAHLAGGGEAAARAVTADPELTRLLRGMAVLKAGLTLAAVGLVAWRVGYPTSPRLLAGLVASAVLLAAGPVLIWHVAPIVAGALLFHAGMVLLLALCWADRSSARDLKAAVARRRRR